MIEQMPSENEDETEQPHPADFGPPEAGKLKAKIGNLSSETIELAEEQRRILWKVGRLCKFFVKQGRERRERFWMLDSGTWMCEGWAYALL